MPINSASCIARDAMLPIVNSGPVGMPGGAWIGVSCKVKAKRSFIELQSYLPSPGIRKISKPIISRIIKESIINNNPTMADVMVSRAPAILSLSP